MANIAGFDATQVGDMQKFGVIPAHKAMMMITSSELKPTKSTPPGQRLSLTMEIVGEGQYKGRKMFVGLNMVNANTQAQDIAQRELGAICKAIGVLKPNDSIELHNKPFIGDIGVKPAKAAQPAGPGKPAVDARDAENVMRGYEPAAAGAVTTPAPADLAAAAPAGAAPAAAAGAPPWAKK